MADSSSSITLLLAAISPISALIGVWLGQHVARRNTENQWLKDQKVKVYGDILRALNEYSLWLLDTSQQMKFGNEGPAQATIDKENQQIAAEFHAAYAVAPLFVGKKSWGLIESARPVFFSHSDPLEELDQDSVDGQYDKLIQIRSDLVLCAKSDLAVK